MASNDAKTKEEELKWWQWVFRNKICSQIAALEAEVAEYESFKSMVVGLKDDLFGYSTAFKKIHALTSSGVSYVEFDASISKIAEYGNNVERNVATLEGVIADIDAEIQAKRDQISALRAQL